MQSFNNRARSCHRSVAAPSLIPHRCEGIHVGSELAHRRATGTIRAL